MLFSSREVADYINATFEPAWESVRPAPLVTLDFGNGHIIRRTLQGNIATYVCGPSGIVYDVLPGIYTPGVYCRELEACKLLADSLRQPPGAVPPVTEAGRQRVEWDTADRLRIYHTQQTARLVTASQTPQVQAAMPQMQAVAQGFQSGGGFKGGGGFGGGGNFQGELQVVGRTGGGFKGGFGGGGQFQGDGGFQGGGFGGFGGIEGPTQRVIMGLPPAPGLAVIPSGPLATRPEMILDTQVNELIRRRAVHERLVRVGAVRPDDIKKWLFKEVLHADLDDPLLGLGVVLNANYPFSEEDRAAGRP